MVGLVVVGLWALINLDSFYTHTPAISLLAVLLAGAVLLLGRSRPANSTAGSLLILAAVVTVLSLLDLIAVLSNLDRLHDFGGIAGLIGFIIYFVGGLFMLWGALKTWHPVHSESSEETHLAERLGLIGGVVVVGAWVFMILAPAPGWVLVTDQAIGVTAATVTGVLVLSRRTGTSPLSLRGTRITLIVTGAVVVIMAVSTLTRVLPEWDLVVLVGGPRMYVPYGLYLAGAAFLGAAATMLLRTVRGRGLGKTGTAASVIVVLVGLATVLAGRDSDPAPSNGEAPTPIEEAASPVTVEGPNYAPVDGCSLLTEFEVLEGLATGYPAELRISDTAEENCRWEYEAWAVEVGPGDYTDFAPGATLGGEEPTEGVPVTGVGDVAMWFSTDRQGIISVAQQTRLGVVFVRLLVRQPEMDDAGRLEAAKNLAAKVIERLQMPPLEPIEVDLCGLVTDEEAEEVLEQFRRTHSIAFREEEMFVFQSGTVDLTRPGRGARPCNRMLALNLSSVEVAAGLPTGFEAGAELEGVVGQPVAGVGDQAIWFSGDFGNSIDFGGATGVLNLRQGLVYFRIQLRLPEAAPDEQLEIAQDLALKALGRLPGGVPLMTFEPEPPDLARVSYVDNLLAKVDDGEWTLGEGLVATLRMIAGEVAPEQVLRHGEVLSREATGIVQLAHEHLEHESDPDVQAEIARLLEILLLSNADLEAMAGIGPPTVALPAIRSLGFAQATEIKCQEFFRYFVAPGVGPCLEFESADFLADFLPVNYGKFRVFYPAPSLPTAGWTIDHYQLALDTLVEAVPVFHQLGQLAPVGLERVPDVNIVFSVSQFGTEGPSAGAPFAQAWGAQIQEGEPCGIVLYPAASSIEWGLFKQVIAHELAHCFGWAAFPEQNWGPGEERAWWVEGLAEYLSNVVYPSVQCTTGRCDGEWEWMDNLAATELSTTLFQRAYDNSIFFQFLSWELGNEGTMGLIRIVPADWEKQEEAVAGYRNMSRLYHKFSEAMTDESIKDTGGGLVPFAAQDWQRDVEGPQRISGDPPSFGLTRLRLSVSAGRYACIEYEQSGELRVSWRPGSSGGDGNSGNWEILLPKVLEGEAVYVASAVKPGAGFAINVTDVVADRDDCEEEEPTYVPPPPPDCQLRVCIGTSNFYQQIEWLAQWFACLARYATGQECEVGS